MLCRPHEKPLAPSASGCPPQPPHVNGFHLYLPGAPETLRERHLELAAATGDWLFGTFAATGAHGQSVVEIQVDDATGDFTDDEVVERVTQLISH